MKAVSALAMVFVASLSIITVEGVYLFSIVEDFSTLKKSIMEMSIIGEINKLEILKRHLYQALIYSFYQSQYDTSKLGGYSDMSQASETYKNLPYWRIYSTTYLPDYQKNIESLILSFFKKYLDKIETEVQISTPSNVEIIRKDSDFASVKVVNDKLKLTKGNLAIEEKGNVLETVKTNVFKMFDLAKSKFITTDSINQAVLDGISASGLSTSGSSTDCGSCPSMETVFQSTNGRSISQAKYLIKQKIDEKLNDIQISGDISLSLEDRTKESDIQPSCLPDSAGSCCSSHDECTATAPGKWTMVDDTGWSVSNGELRGTNTRGRLRSTATFSAPLIQEVKVRAVTSASNGQTIGGFWNSATDGFTLLQSNPDYVRNDTDWISLGDVIPEGNPLLLKFSASSTSVRLTSIRLDTGAIVYDGTFTNTIATETIMIGRRADDTNTGQAYDTYWDWIRVRKYTSPEPTTSIEAEQSTSALTGWLYRKPIKIGNTANSNSLADYQVLVTLDTASLISAGKIRSDCGDIRFTDNDGSSLINYWLESGCNTTSTKIWVKVPSIPSCLTKTIYLYYGNTSATSVSNGDSTFEFFDDFLGTDIDTGGCTSWTTVCDAYYCTKTCSFTYYGAARALAKITDTKVIHPVYDGTTDLRNLKLNLYVLSGNKQLISP